MLPVCSTIANCFSNSQVCLYGGCRHFSLSRKAFTVKCIIENDAKVHVQGLQQLNSLRFADQFIGKDRSLPRAFNLRNTVIATNIPDDPASASMKPDIYSEYLSKTDSEDVFAGINESLSALVCNTDTAISNTLKTITSSVEAASKGVNGAIDGSVNNLKLSVSSALSGLSNNSKGVSSKAGGIAVDGLRTVIVTVEELVSEGAMFLVYAYASAKDMLPPELQNVLNSSEDKAYGVLKPIGTTFQQVYVSIEGFERIIGIDPSDPIVPFVLLLGTSTTLWASYWILTYAGYAGDLSPKLAFELLKGKESVALIDVRPEDFRERDGIPDLRRTARFRYASVEYPEVDTGVKKLLKSGKDLDDALVAAVIRNLKVVQQGSKVIVMDADGTRSKGIARSLRKLGIKRPYLVQGGFRSWVQEGLRVKDPKPETTLTILNEEAEAILEGITPFQVIGYGMGFLATAFALLEWEKTLQFIAVAGIGQTIYRRIASYEDSNDFKRDVGQLVVPVKLGGQAISWAAAKLESNRNGLPTSPSSVNVQNRVLQAAAKHESQPPEQPQDSTPNPDLSEA
ncbi:uncharacterized protein LOC111893494 isoform X1 [Lactuca sativa]|uniref:uncharacterized protein LOC111893494 isoform X1 n=3 Tax=Lactuca sativa TaxID=4236 RepID=UPI000CD7ECFA|nr:uncharacterized protein LOC111893494 isoform X1 [Lactuca sativa]